MPKVRERSVRRKNLHPVGKKIGMFLAGYRARWDTNRIDGARQTVLGKTAYRFADFLHRAGQKLILGTTREQPPYAIKQIIEERQKIGKDKTH